MAALRTIAELTATTADLVRVAEQATLPDSAATKQISRARITLDEQVQVLRRVTQAAPSLRINIAEEAQRASAQDLQLRIANVKYGEGVIEVPDIDLPSAIARKQLAMESGKPQPAVLRCFRVWECERDGRRLLGIINAQLVTPRVTLQDMSHGNAGNNKLPRVRERQFELWFGPGPIELQAEQGATTQ
jgi:hypothetical protein